MNACGQPNSVRSQGDPWSESAGSKERTLTSLRSIVPGSSLPIRSPTPGGRTPTRMAIRFQAK